MPSRKRHRRFHLAAAAIAAVATLAPTALLPAQEDDGFYSREPTQGVYVRDSAVALEKFPLVARLERMNEWGKAADVLQEVLENYPDRVIQTATNNDGEVIRYTSVANAVQQQIARWPAEGLAAYRARFEPIAEARFSTINPGDIPALRQIYWQYFNTAPALRAGIQLIDLYFRQGDFRAARDIAQRLLRLHPLLEEQRPALLYRAALLAHLVGDDTAARELLDTLRTNHAPATGTIAGQIVTFADALQQELQTTPATAQPASPDHWPILGGDLTRGRVSAARGRTGARLFRIPLSAPDYGSLSAEQRAALESQQQQFADNGNRLGVMPVVDDGQLFFQDGRRIYAVSLESGQPLPAWQQTYPGGAYVADTTPMPAGHQLTVTVTDDAVVAVMGFADPPADPRGLSRIVCLDRDTGRERWVVRPGDLPDRDALRTLNFSGSPLVVGDSVHVIGRGGKGAQFEDCYLVTLDARTGALRWATYLASASTDQVNIFGGRRGLPRSSDTTSHVAYAGGKLYVLTNLGAVAAVDAYSGIIDWLSIYQRNVPTEVARSRRFGARTRVELPRPWTFNPVIAADGRLFVLPSDGDDLLIYDAETGEQLKSIRASHLDNPDTIVGVLGDRLVVSGDERIKCINWQRYDPDAYTDSNIEIIYWPRRFAGSPIRGRPFMTTDSVFVPTRRRLYQMDLHTGKIVASHPADNTVEWEEGPGNVLVTSDRVVVATATSVDVYTDLALARAKLDAEVAASPEDPQIRLRYAEVMFVAGREDIALAKLDEAVTLLGGLNAMRSGPARQRLFYTALRYAEQMAARSGEFSTNLAHQLYDRAAAAADTPSQQVQYRLSRAQFADLQADKSHVAELYQQILDDPELRLVTVSDARWGGATQAAAAAEQEIASLIRRAGRGVYARFDELAGQAATAAANDPQALLALAARYPNAEVAPTALLSAANAFEAAGEHRLATRTLRQISHKYPDAVPKARVLEAMARNYLAMPNRIEVAISRLSHGVRVAGNPMLQQPLVLPDGTTIEGVSFADAANMLREHASRIHERPAPDFHLPTRDWGMSNRGKSPFPDEARKRITGIDALVPVVPGYARPDRIVTWSSDQGIAIYPAGSTTALGKTDTATDPPVQAAWVDDGLLVWTPTRLTLLDPDSAEVKWTLMLRALPPIELVEGDAPITEGTAPAIVLDDDLPVNVVNNRVQAARPLLAIPDSGGGEERFVQLAISADRAMLITSTGRLVAADMANGSLAWQTRLLDGVPIDRVVANDDFAVVRLVRDDRVDLVVFDTYSGELISRRSFAASSGTIPLNFALAADGTLVYVLPDRVCAKDLYDPGEELSWEVPGQAPGRRVYDGAVHPDHLKIHDGRIIVLSDEGQFVRMHSLQTGRLIRYAADEGGREVEALLSTGTQGWDTRLLIDGTYLYAISPRSLIAYNLDNPQQTWRGPNDPAVAHNYRDALIGSDYIVLLDAPGARDGGAPPSPLYNLFAFSRTHTRSGESGLMVLSPSIRDRSGIRAWQGAEGGLYYLSGDRTLHFLGGIRP